MDVVPAGDLSLWEHDPYDPWLKDGKLYGRGACDMKGSIACFMHVMETIKKYNIQHDEDKNIIFSMMRIFGLLQ